MPLRELSRSRDAWWANQQKAVSWLVATALSQQPQCGHSWGCAVTPCTAWVSTELPHESLAQHRGKTMWGAATRAHVNWVSYVFLKSCTVGWMGTPQSPSHEWELDTMWCRDLSSHPGREHAHPQKHVTFVILLPILSSGHANESSAESQELRILLDDQNREFKIPVCKQTSQEIFGKKKMDVHGRLLSKHWPIVWWLIPSSVWPVVDQRQLSVTYIAPTLGYAVKQRYFSTFISYHVQIWYTFWTARICVLGSFISLLIIFRLFFHSDFESFSY